MSASGGGARSPGPQREVLQYCGMPLSASLTRSRAKLFIVIGVVLVLGAPLVFLSDASPVLSWMAASAGIACLLVGFAQRSSLRDQDVNGS